MAAQRGGASRVELCSALLEGGLTPSAGTIAETERRLSIDVHVMIRPRGADFCYTDTEFEVMQRDIDLVKRLRADGVVFGLLTADGDVDVERTRVLVAHARPLSVTFHRAFDMARDPLASLDRLIELGIDRLLTSAQEASALEGVELLRTLVERAGDRLLVMPACGGLHAGAVRRVLDETGASEVHVTGTRAIESPMRHRNPRCFMGGELRPPEFSTTVTDAERIGELVKAARDGEGGQ